MRTLGEWSDKINAFWLGANGCEYIAWKGSHHIFIYDSVQSTDPPSDIIQHDKRIETLEEFTDALENGTYMKANYKLYEKCLICGQMIDDAGLCLFCIEDQTEYAHEEGIV